VRKIASLLLLLTLPFVGLACDERTEETDSGGVLLEVDFGTVLPLRASVNDVVGNNGSLVQVEAVTFTSIVANPNAVASDLMNIELESFEVVFQRVDGGTRLPPPYVVKLLATIPAGGSFTINDLELMSFDQLNNPPLSDLLFANGGFDKETGLTFIRMNLFIRAFGRTLGGRRVESVPRPHTMEFTQ